MDESAVPRATVKHMRTVVIESPYSSMDQAGIELNLRYLRACMADCLARGEAPFASHGLYTQPGVLNDRNQAERNHGIDAGNVWRVLADATVVYTDLGISSGMAAGINEAEILAKDEVWGLESGSCGAVHKVEYRTLGWPWDDPDATQSYTLNAAEAHATSCWGE